MKKLFIILLSALSLTAVAQSDVKRVAILETVDKMGNVPYLKQLMFRSNLTTAITNTSGYEGYDRTDLKEILGEQNFQRTGMVSDKDIKKIGEFTGAQYVLIAEATIDGNDMFITAKIIDVETARVLRNSNQLMGTSASEMQEGSKKVAEDLLGVAKVTKVQQTKVSTPKTIPAGYVDLGLPSGTLWKANNEDCGLLTYDQAANFYGNSLPTKEQLQELKDNCLWTWQDNGYYAKGKNGNMTKKTDNTQQDNGYIVKGKNGESIFLPAAGWRNCDGSVRNVGKDGYYWSSTPYSSENAWHLNFVPSAVYVSNYFRCFGFSVRLVR